MRQRVANWQSEFFRVLADAQDRPFDWNGWTCFDFAATMYVALTGKPDPRPAFGEFTSERQAQVALGRAGGAEAILRSVLGDPIHPAMAQRGDIVLVEFGQGLQPAICVGVESLAPGRCGDREGLMRIKTLKASLAWEV
jgi:hypothetical protein